MQTFIRSYNDRHFIQLVQIKYSFHYLNYNNKIILKSRFVSFVLTEFSYSQNNYVVESWILVWNSIGGKVQAGMRTRQGLQWTTLY